MNKNEKTVGKGFWGKVRRAGRKIPFVNDAIAMYDYVCDGDVHPARKAVAVAALAYFICPLDAIPDLTPIVGYLDDAGVIAVAVAYYRSELDPYYER
jgi:uncharacterized membrane protein YkvA (DUF1232 family)